MLPNIPALGADVAVPPKTDDVGAAAVAATVAAGVFAPKKPASVLLPAGATAVAVWPPNIEAPVAGAAMLPNTEPVVVVVAVEVPPMGEAVVAAVPSVFPKIDEGDAVVVVVVEAAVDAAVVEAAVDAAVLPKVLLA